MDYNTLLPPEIKEPEIERQIDNGNPFFIPSKSIQNNITIYGNKCTCCTYMLLPILFILITAFMPIALISFNSKHQTNFFNYKIYIVLAFNFIFYLLIYLYILYIHIFKLEINKDDVKNQIIIVRKNYLCCKKIYNILLENAYYFCNTILNEDNNRCKEKNNIYVLNTFKNTSEIDLENSNLINAPIEFYYKFENLNGNSEELNVKLKAWTSNNKYKNGIDDEIKKYKKKYKNKETVIDNFHGFGLLDDKMKLSDFFYTFNFSDEKFKRIDIIYSKNYDKMFIGVVKNDKAYINRLILNINTIDKFAMSMEQKGFGFKALLKGTINQIEICDFFHQNQNSLEDFLFLLNGKLEDINEGILIIVR